MFLVPQIHRFSWFWNNPGNGYSHILHLTTEKTEVWRECVALPPTPSCGAGQLGLLLSGSLAGGHMKAPDHSLLLRCKPSRAASVLPEGRSHVCTDHQSPPEPMTTYVIQVHVLGIKRGTCVRNPLFSPRGRWCENSNSSWSPSLLRVWLIWEGLRMFLTLLDELFHWGRNPQKLWLEEMKWQSGLSCHLQSKLWKAPSDPSSCPAFLCLFGVSRLLLCSE